jgi:hypothetical protein
MCVYFILFFFLVFFVVIVSQECFKDFYFYFVLCFCAVRIVDKIENEKEKRGSSTYGDLIRQHKLCAPRRYLLKYVCCYLLC